MSVNAIRKTSSYVSIMDEDGMVKGKERFCILTVRVTSLELLAFSFQESWPAYGMEIDIRQLRVDKRRRL